MGIFWRPDFGLLIWMLIDYLQTPRIQGVEQLVIAPPTWALGKDHFDLLINEKSPGAESPWA
jgi:hypothetical protein